MGNLEQRSLFVAMPVYRVMDAFTAQCLIKLTAEQLTQNEFSMKLRFHIGECPIGRARNDLTHEFLKSNCTHILFIDSDIIFSYEQVRKILFNNEDVVGGFYTKKQEGNVSLVCNTVDKVEQPREDDLIQVKYMGTGFLCVSRRVFEKMIEKIGDQIAYVDDGDCKTIKYDFWRMGVSVDCVTGVKRWLSEDWQFCQFAIECGFKVWADASILLRHSGGALFPLSYQYEQLYPPEKLARMREMLTERKRQEILVDEVQNYQLPFDYKPGSVLDIGANRGYFSAWCHNQWPDAKIVAYEPVPENYDELRLRCPYAEAIPYAVRNFTGMDGIVMGDEHYVSGFYDLGRWPKDKKTIAVDCINAKDVKACDLVKIDTEGCELEILSKFDLKDVKVLLCEYHRKADISEIQECAKKAGLVEVEHLLGDLNSGLLKFARPEVISASPVRGKATVGMGACLPTCAHADLPLHISV